MIGKTISHYQITAKIGQGGMGEVYRAHDPRLDRDVAIKVLNPELADDSVFLSRFTLEGKTIAALSHPNTISIHDVGVHNGLAFTVMELLEGRDLAAEIKDIGALTIESALDHASKIAQGLAAIHNRGIIHRDLKPANVFLTSDGQTKILDFGLAKMPQSNHSAAASDPTKFLTAADTLLGTPNYMSPERIKGADSDERGDIFAWALILYEMLTGKNPFSRGSVAETMSAILNDEPPDLNRKGLSPDVIRLIAEGLQKDPRLRLGSADTAAARLQSFRAAAYAPTEDTIDSLAVLPFHNEAQDEDADYLIDGLTDLLIDNLSQLPRLRVLARSTVFRCRDQYDRPSELGRELGVRAVLTGRLQQRRGSLIIRAELVNAEDGTRLWAGLFNREASDLLAIEEELCNEITTRLRFRLTHEEQDRIAKKHTENPAAHEAYLQGRFFWNRWKTPEAMRTAIGFFERALALDPMYARAYAGLADSYGILGNIKSLPPSEAYPKAKTAVMQGLAIDDNLAELHSSLGFILRFWEWDWEGSRRAFERAVALNPGYSPAYRFYGHLLSGLGRHEQAIILEERALELDPLSPIIRTALGDALFYAGRYDEAMEHYRQAIAMDAGFIPGHTDLARALELAGRYEEAVAEYQLAEGLAPKGTAEPSSGLAHVYAQMGRHDEALEILVELKSLASHRYVSPYGIASIYACLGEIETALDWLDKAFADHDQTLVWVKVHPRLDALHGHSRFEQLLVKMQLNE